MDILTTVIIVAAIGVIASVVLVVAANQDTILNTDKAPKEMKYKILRADALVRQIEYDFNHRDSDEIFSSKKEMEETAKSYVNISIKEDIDYYDHYKYDNE